MHVSTSYHVRNLRYQLGDVRSLCITTKYIRTEKFISKLAKYVVIT